MKLPDNYWTKEKCKEMALKCNTRIEFKKTYQSAYTISVKNKWLNDVCAHLKYMNKYWNYDDCKNESLKYENRTDFQRKSHGAYEFSKKHNFLDEICQHMDKQGDRYHRCIYVFEFDDNSAYIGLTYNIKIRHNEHKIRGPVYEHILKTGSNYKLIKLTEYILPKDARHVEESTIKKYEISGWNLLNTKSKSSLGGNTIIWNYEKCKDEALKYNHRTEFNTISRGASNSARKNGWYDEICYHMTYNKPDNHWSSNEIDFLIHNYNKGIKYCAKYLNKSYYSVKSQYQKKKSNK